MLLMKYDMESNDDHRYPVKVISSARRTKSRGRNHMGHGGKRIGAGRKRLHESGYKHVKFCLWKNLSVHADVYQWIELEEYLGLQE